jgi:hypothetical protein
MPTRRTRLRRGVIVLLAAVALSASGCALVGGTSRTVQGLRNAGYANGSISRSTSGSAVTIDASADQNPSVAGTAVTKLAAETRDVAGIVWSTLPGRFSVLAITVRGLGQRSFTHARLVTLFGPRPRSLDTLPYPTTVQHGHLSPIVVVLVIVAAVALVAIVAISRRAREAESPEPTALRPPGDAADPPYPSSPPLPPPYQPPPRHRVEHRGHPEEDDPGRAEEPGGREADWPGSPPGILPPPGTASAEPHGPEGGQGGPGPSTRPDGG